MGNIHTLSNTLSSLILQLEDLIYKLEKSEYIKEQDVISGSSIGQHIRHILEFIEIFIQQSEGRNVFYDARKRDLRLENDVEFAMHKIQSLLKDLEYISISQNITLQSTINPETHHSIQVSSTIERELLYLIEHTIHHMAIIGNAVRYSLPNIKIDKHFGYAFATIVHNKTKEQA